MIARLRRWRRSVIVVPRWLATASYFGFFLLGVAVTVAGSPTLDLTTSGAYRTIWGVLVALTSVVAFIGSFSEPLEKLERLERWGAIGLASLLTAYLGGALVLAINGGDRALGRVVSAIVIFFIFLIPVVRAAQLLRTTGRN